MRKTFIWQIMTHLMLGYGFNRTALKFLILELQKAGEPISDLEIPLLTSVAVDLDEDGEPLKRRAKLNEDGTEKPTRNRRNGDDNSYQTSLYWSHFPNARRLTRGRKGVLLHPSIRTDGISCSVSTCCLSEKKITNIKNDLCSLFSGASFMLCMRKRRSHRTHGCCGAGAIILLLGDFTVAYVLHFDNHCHFGPLQHNRGNERRQLV